MHKVTAGIPSLTPGKRDLISGLRAGHENNKRLLKDQIGRDSATVAPDGDLDPTNWQQRLGRPVTSDEMERRLKYCNRNLIFEPSLADPSKIGIYIVENRDGMAAKRFLCGMGRGHMPEYSFLVPKWERAPDPDNPGEWIQVKQFSQEVRGWRTVLMRLKKDKIITQYQIENYWPLPYGQSRNWQILTN
jgi:hypothetical protein